MLIQCPQCETTFKLDEKLLPAEGSLVRCSRCAHVFRVEPPAEEFPATGPDVYEKGEATAVTATVEAVNEHRPFSDEEEIIASRPSPPRRKWGGTLVLFALLILLAVAVRYSYLQLLNPRQEFREVLKEVFFIPTDPEGSKKIRLSEVKGYFKEHATNGRFFVVEGKVTNGYTEPRNRIRLRGTLQDASRRVVAKRDLTAGWTLPAEELETRSLAEINRLQESQAGPLTAGTALMPGGTAPFLIIFSPVAQPLSEFSVEVLGSRKNVPGTPAAR